MRLVGVIRVHVLDDAGHFADALRQAAYLAHPGEAEQIDLALQLGNEIRLKRVERDRRQAHDQILGEDEAERGQQQPGLEQRRDHGIAEIAAERFDLAGDHGDQLALGQPAELRQGKTQDPAEQLRAQPAQHGLAEAAFVHVDDVLEAAIDQYREQEQTREKSEILELIELPEFDAGEADGFGEIGAVAADRPVDDLFGQVERGVVDRQRGEGQEHQYRLLRQAELDDVAEQRDRQAVRIAGGQKAARERVQRVWMGCRRACRVVTCGDLTWLRPTLRYGPALRRDPSVRHDSVSRLVAARP